MVSQLCLLCGSTYNCQTLCLGARPRYNLVVDEDFKKPTQPTNQPKNVDSAMIFIHLAIVSDVENKYLYCHAIRIHYYVLKKDGGEGGGAVAQSVERATLGGEIPGSILVVAARSLLVGSVSVVTG